MSDAFDLDSGVAKHSGLVPESACAQKQLQKRRATAPAPHKPTHTSYSHIRLVGRTGFVFGGRKVGSVLVALANFQNARGHDWSAIGGMAEFRWAKDYTTGGSPRIEASLGVQRKLFDHNSIHMFATGGAMFQRYYNEINV